MKSKRDRKGEQGFVLVVAALAMMMLMVLLAFVVDASLVLVVRSNLQTGLDAAALAGVNEAAASTQKETRVQLTAQTKTQWFNAGEALPDPQSVQSQVPEYRTVCQDQVDQQTGQVKQVCHSELAGWWITYITGYAVDPTTIFGLQQAQARATAQRILQENAAAWRRSGGLPMEDPVIVRQVVTCEPAGQPSKRREDICEPGFDAYIFRYRIEDGQVRVRTLLAGYVLGDHGWVTVDLSGIEASVRFGKQP